MGIDQLGGKRTIESLSAITEIVRLPNSPIIHIFKVFCGHEFFNTSLSSFRKRGTMDTASARTTCSPVAMKPLKTGSGSCSK